MANPSKDKVTAGGNNVIFYCFGCKALHAIPNKDFNGNLELPTINYSAGSIVFGSRDTSVPQCHFYMVAGKLFYWTSYCAHKYAGTVVEMPTVDQWYKDIKLNHPEPPRFPEVRRLNDPKEDSDEFFVWGAFLHLGTYSWRNPPRYVVSPV